MVIFHRVLVEDVASATANGARERQPVHVRAAQLAKLGCLGLVIEALEVESDLPVAVVRVGAELAVCSSRSLNFVDVLQG